MTDETGIITCTVSIIIGYILYASAVYTVLDAVTHDSGNKTVTDVCGAMTELLGIDGLFRDKDICDVCILISQNLATAICLLLKIEPYYSDRYILIA